MSYREELKYRTIKSIHSSGSAGITLYKICEEVFDTDDIDKMGIDMNIVFRILDELLKEGKVFISDVSKIVKEYKIKGLTWLATTKLAIWFFIMET